MDKDKLALIGLLGNGISGWVNNITDKEKRISSLFLKDPKSISPLCIDENKIILCPLLSSRIKRIVKKYGIESIDIINELLWGIIEDKKNTPIPFSQKIKIFKQIRKPRGG